MKKVYSVEEYIENNDHFGNALIILRNIINSTELEETIKWSMPTYCINGKNVLGIGAFKKHFCIWFHQGVFLKDNEQILVNAQEDKTKGMRQMRFNSPDDINKNAVLKYVKEAIKNQKLGKEIKPARSTSKKEVIIPKELKSILKENRELNKCFITLTPSKRREYSEYIETAKRDVTKQTRLEKIIPMIKNGIGLNDKYKNC